MSVPSAELPVAEDVPSSSLGGPRSTLIALLTVAAAYGIVGNLSVLMAMPSGYATAVWPASGIALAAALLWGYRVAPGVALGSFSVNIWILWSARTPETFLPAMTLATAIGSGAGLQALFGAWVIRRAGGFQNIFVGEGDVVRILMLGGPVSCCVSSGLGVLSLCLAGQLDVSNALFNWLTWWVGDSIGVLIFMPLACAWSLRGKQWRRQQIALSLPMGAMFLAVVALFFYVSTGEQRRLSNAFQDSALRYSVSLQHAVDTNLQMLNALRSFHAASRAVDRSEFDTFVAGMMPQYPAVQTVSWLPRIEQSQRAEFEQSMRRNGLDRFRLLDYQPERGFVEAATREQYYPVAYIIPMDPNSRILGFDVLGNPMRGNAVQRALSTHRAAASDWLHPFQDNQPHTSTILYLPLYDSFDERPLGMVATLVRLEPLVEIAFAGLREDGLHMRLRDDSEIARTPAISMGPGPIPRADRIAESRVFPIRVADRTWSLEFLLPEDYLLEHRSWMAWGMLAAGLTLAALLGMLMLVLLARQARIEEGVARRTAELHAAQLKLSSYAADLERSNKELAQFASIASHDLQAPVRGVLSFVQLLKERYSGRVLEGKGEEFLALIEQSAKNMKGLIDGLLALSRIGRTDDDQSDVDCNGVLVEVEAQLAGIVEERSALITHDRLPTVRGSRLEIFQVLQNLIVNGLKFQPGNAPRIHVYAQREEGMWRISVRDHGIGIAPRHQERIFRIFQRLHTTAYEGTGIGLAICEKIVSGHGGRIWVESAPGMGATFHFTLPASE